MRSNGLMRGVLALPSLCGLALLVILPLGWREQAALGAALILVAILLNGASRSATVTLALVTLSVFSTLRYGYWRVIQTWGNHERRPPAQLGHASCVASSDC